LEKGESMADKDAYKVGRGSIPADLENELLHDHEGNQYVINDSYVREQLQQRVPSEGRELELQLAREMLNSNLRQLTERQKDVMYYTMVGKSQRDTAKLLGISQTAVSQHLSAARKKLAKLINQTKEVISHGTGNTDQTDTNS